MAVQVHHVLREFTDLKDNRRKYLPGENYYFGDEKSDRTKELKGSNNKHGKPIIKPFTKDELVEYAEKHTLDVDKKAKVAELHEVVADYLNK